MFVIDYSIIVYAISLISVGFTVGLTYSKLDKRIALISQSLESFKVDYYKYIVETNKKLEKQKREDKK